MKFVCQSCGKEHEEFPAIGFNSPLYYHCLSDEEKELAELTSDYCIVKEEEHIHRFIRGVLVQKINDGCQDMEYGLWVSVSEKNFNDYQANSNDENHKEVYFGWLNGHLPEYKEEDMESIKTNVITQGGSLRPLIELQPDNNMNSKFVKDYVEGISEAEALRRIDTIFNS